MVTSTQTIPQLVKINSMRTVKVKKHTRKGKVVRAHARKKKTYRSIPKVGGTAHKNSIKKYESLKWLALKDGQSATRPGSKGYAEQLRRHKEKHYERFQEHLGNNSY